MIGYLFSLGVCVCVRLSGFHLPLLIHPENHPLTRARCVETASSQAVVPPQSIPPVNPALFPLMSVCCHLFLLLLFLLFSLCLPRPAPALTASQAFVPGLGLGLEVRTRVGGNIRVRVRVTVNPFLLSVLHS